MNGNRARRSKEDNLLEKAIKAFHPHYKELLKMETTDHLIELDDKLRTFIKENVSGISSSQLRKLYDKILTQKTARDIQLLRPIFAYTIARQNNDKSKQVMLLIDALAKELKDDEKDVKGFKRFMEALVAYHKYYEVTKS